jgi:transcriptional regulator with XRE-family HTH domain
MLLCVQMTYMSVTDAIHELRRESGLNQQYLATDLRISIRAMSQYENGKTPEPKTMLKFYAYALKLRRTDLATVFSNAFVRELDPPPGVEVFTRCTVVDTPSRKGNK